MTAKSLPCLTPTGTCWCGCAKKAGAGSFFAPGHDKVAEAALPAVAYGSSVARLPHGHGYGPGHPVSARAVSEGVWRKCPACDHVGAPASITDHTKKARTAAVGERAQGAERRPDRTPDSGPTSRRRCARTAAAGTPNAACAHCATRGTIRRTSTLGKSCAISRAEVCW
ncbi:hypothetical protein [Streptomyces pimonensis]|uniref:hypothetical protein n=1 Tax=Streptomyces pimonensis TaxID=2860288 RepID=UPI0035294AA3